MKPKMRIREFREAAGLNQPELGEIIHKISTIKSWEAGKSFPNADSVCQMCELLTPTQIHSWVGTTPIRAKLPTAGGGRSRRNQRIQVMYARVEAPRPHGRGGRRGRVFKERRMFSTCD